MIVKNRTTAPIFIGNYTLPSNLYTFLPDKLYQGFGLEGKQVSRIAERPVELCGPDVVIFSGCPLGTTGGGQHPPQIARALVRQGCRVYFFQISESADPEEDNLFVLQSRDIFRVRPMDSTDRIATMNLLADLSHHDQKILLLTFPSQFLADVAEVAKGLGYRTIYWCLDDWEQITAYQENLYFKPEHEEAIIRNCDQVIATAINLSRKIEAKHNRSCPVIPNGFSLENFPPSTTETQAPYDHHRGVKTFVYWGELQGRWFNWRLIEAVAQRNPSWTFNLIGPYAQSEHIIALPNVYYLGEKPVGDLMPYGLHSDFGLIPFKESRLSDAVNPIKVYEYLACGLPVLGTKMRELNHFPNTFQVSTAEEFEQMVWQHRHFLKPQNHLNAFLRGSTWDNRATSLLKVIS